MSFAWLALGGNVGDGRALLQQAIEKLCDGGDIRLVARSSEYRTPPWGVTEQPSFINLCIAVETTLAPSDLLARAHDVERAFGRDRAHEQRWGPRAVDIDILAYDNLSIQEPDLILPHPRLFQRAFVLVPLSEIAPDLHIAGTRVGDAAQTIERNGIVRLPPR